METTITFTITPTLTVTVTPTITVTIVVTITETLLREQSVGRSPFGLRV